MEKSEFLEAGEIVSTHGIRGFVEPGQLLRKITENFRDILCHDNLLYLQFTSSIKNKLPAGTWH